MTKKETTFFFVNTFLEPYYEKMIGNAIQNFVERVWLEELIEHGIKNKKIERKSTPTVKKSTPSKKKERDTHTVFTNHQSKLIFETQKNNFHTKPIDRFLHLID